MHLDLPLSLFIKARNDSRVAVKNLLLRKGSREKMLRYASVSSDESKLLVHIIIAVHKEVRREVQQ